MQETTDNLSGPICKECGNHIYTEINWRKRCSEIGIEVVMAQCCCCSKKKVCHRVHMHKVTIPAKPVAKESSIKFFEKKA